MLELFKNELFRQALVNEDTVIEDFINREICIKKNNCAEVILTQIHGKQIRKTVIALSAVIVQQSLNRAYIGHVDDLVTNDMMSKISTAPPMDVTGNGDD